MLEKIHISNNISYLPASTNPLSCDIVFIQVDNVTWIFDVGASEQAAIEINKIEGKKNIVLSHFHPDHISNLDKINYDNLYVGKNTVNYTKTGTIVEKLLTFTDCPIKIYTVPSSHAKGCLCIVYEDYAFMGDSTYCNIKIGNHTYNTQLLKDEIGFLKSLNCTYVCLDHEKQFIQKRTTLITLLEKIYSRRTTTSPTINVEDFFNPDGSLKTQYSYQL